MTNLEELNALDGIFAGFASNIPLVHENEKYEGASTEWVRLTSQTADAKQITLGSDPTHRYYGVCFLQIFTKPDIGAARSMVLADSVTTLLRGKTIDGMTFKVPKVVKVGSKDGWYQVNVLTEFYRED